MILFIMIGKLESEPKELVWNIEYWFYSYDLEKTLDSSVLAELKRNYPCISIDGTQNDKMWLNFFVESINRLGTNVKKIGTFDHQIPWFISHSVDDSIKRKEIFYMLGCFATTPIIADILKKNNIEFYLRLEMFFDKTKWKDVIHLSLQIPEDMDMPETSESYSLDFVRRNKVQISKWVYKNPYGATSDQTKKIMIHSNDLQSDVPILQTLSEKVSQGTPYNSDEILQQYINAFKSSNTLDEYKDYTIDVDNYKEETGDARDIQIVGF